MSSDSSGSSSSSTSAFVSSLIFNLVILTIMLLIFVCLRPREKRVYQPRCEVKTQPVEQIPEPAGSGPFSWLLACLKLSETSLIRYAGVDAYFFLRYLFTFTFLCFLGCIMLLPILLPINATNGNGKSGFDIISFSNVKNHNRFYAHVFLSWIFFGAVIFVIYRELRFYVVFRHAIQASPLYDQSKSSQCMVISELPKFAVENIDTVREHFPNASRIEYVHNIKKLQKRVEKRSGLGDKYEGTLNGLINKSVAKRNKLIKKQKELPTELELTSYVKKRPTHRLTFLIGKKVDTIDYCRDEIAKLNKEIDELQTRAEDQKKVGSVILEFPTQSELQMAYQAFLYSPKFRRWRLGRVLLNVNPDEIIWNNLTLSTPERYARRFAANSVLTVMIIFWAIPVAVVGCISNINFLTSKVHFLRFIDNMPPKLMGIITGILPTVAYAVLMSLVPPFIKFMGKMGGGLTIHEIERYCQTWFYGFQTVQGFLVLTLTSAASSAVISVVEKPQSAMNLLASNLPRASNYYISQFLLQGLSFPGGALAQIVALALSKIIGRIFDSTPRQKWSRWIGLSQPSWGVLYPTYSLLVVIMLCYAIIAPIIMGFALVGLTLIYVAYLYNFVYVFGHNADAKGRNYPMALYQTFVGLYLAEICLVGLYVLSKNWGCTVLQALFLGGTVACHVYFKYKFLPLMDIVPLSAIESANERPEIRYPKDLGISEAKATGRMYPSNVEDGEPTDPLDERSGNENGSEAWQVSSNMGDLEKKDEKAIESMSEGTYPTQTKESTMKTPEGNNESGSMQERSNFAVSYLSSAFRKDTIMPTFDRILQILPTFYGIGPGNQGSVKYEDPALKSTPPSIWIGEDPIGLSKLAIEDAEGKVDVFDYHTEFDEEGKVHYTGPPPKYEDAISG
ncbi:calcium ion transmembrane transporter [Schizosaccharomyces osmophilus]|uniref:Calcium ion transmembrane transporter n=1 Tax=Schizosaccharomyces osmophilus TaxID=2545709 RepID=A0AAE9WAA0_9SCHI|nr:calcium ion transmembrane transporter [Schizosaccharomyces osmophilus]WBW71706.1 calcium ion transmembrane transporter [Schizosaccharomyces osmophilus]